jgi:hypothetical protein
VDVARTLHDLAIAVGTLGDANRKKQLLEEVLAALAPKIEGCREELRAQHVSNA